MIRKTFTVKIAGIKNIAMLRASKGFCQKCGNYRFIANKKHGLCNLCNKERLSVKTDIKQLKRSSIRQGKRKSTGERELFLEIWGERPHYCEHCGSYLGDEPRVHFFAHEKGKGAYPEERLNKDNVHLWCLECHNAHDFKSKEDFLKRKLK